MGARGPVPMPTAILKLRGSRHKTGANHVGAEEPQPEPGAPKMPRGLSKPAATLWRVLCRQLEEMGVVSVIDWGQLERYCRFFVRWRECEDFIAENGLTYPLKSTNPPAYVGTIPETGEFVVGWREFPEVKESHRLDEALKHIEASFGLTPSARTRIRAIVAGDKVEESAVPKRKRV